MIPSELIQKGLFWTKGVYSPELMTNKHFNGKVQFNLRLLEAAAKGSKPEVITPWNDLYHPDVTLAQIDKAHQVMEAAKQHTFLIITKRIERAAQDGFFYGVHGLGRHDIPDNIWHIVTCEDQKRADERIPHLLRIPGKRGIIIEPMLEGIDLNNIWAKMPSGGRCLYNLLSNSQAHGGGIHQVILGGETGTGARPMHPDWARSVRDQCHAAGVPFFFKSWGEWLPNSHWSQEARQENWKRLQWGTLTQDGTYFNETTPFNGHDDDGHGGEAAIWRVGKEKAGRQLDRKEHNALAWNVED